MKTASIKDYPYGFNSWLNRLWQVGREMKLWNFTVINYKDKLDKDSWLTYFNWGLSPTEAIYMDLKEQ